ncbi:MAG: cytochrome c biogenesis protein CcdA [Ancalomicrobiaceae bacterium]|nr:cytochrome c biogenesis protein CcdA [Ancalomicrobiaceae bacterium]
MTSSVTLAGALGAGFVSFVSPCVLPLVPPYLAYMAGVGLDELRHPGCDTSVAKRQVVAAAIAFVLGFTTVFVALGVSASLIGQVINAWRSELGILAGLLIVVMGLHFLGLLRIPLLYRQARVDVAPSRPGLVGAYLMGLAFGFGWTPCIGPVLSAILTVSASQDTVGEGGLLLAVYSLGLGLPFLLTALFTGPFMLAMRGARRYLGLVEKAMGAALVATGVVFLSGGTGFMSQWLIDTFPELTKLIL